jgi:glycosyltransferase involved in cell wall biosynthesis
MLGAWLRSYGLMRVDIVDPSAYTPPYDRALCAALGRAGADVRLVTSAFDYGDVPRADGYEVYEHFYLRRPGATNSRTRRVAKLAQHVPGMLSYRRLSRQADVVHFQWLPVQQLDGALLPKDKPLVITAHDVLPREPRGGRKRQHAAQRRLYERADAVVVHSEHGRARLAEMGIDARVIPHGAFDHLDDLKPIVPTEFNDSGAPVIALVGLLRPYKGLDLLYEAWGDGIDDAQLWIAGMPRMELPPAPHSAQVVPRFLSDPELAGVLRRADIVVLPYREIDQSGVLFAALGLGRPLLLSDVGGFPEIADMGAAQTFPAGDPVALRFAIEQLLDDSKARKKLAKAATAAKAGPLSWDRVATEHLALYEDLLR